MRKRTDEASPRPSAPLRTAVLGLAILALLASRGIAGPKPAPARPSLSAHDRSHHVTFEFAVGSVFRR
jgi:hypothetical protein